MSLNKGSQVTILALGVLFFASVTQAVDRRYPPLSHRCDTVVVRNGEIVSAHQDDMVPFIRDEEIVRVIPIVKKERMTTGDYSIEVEISELGYPVVQQQAVRGCSAAGTYMLALDNGVVLNPRILPNRNVDTSGNQVIQRDLVNGGLKSRIGYLPTHPGGRLAALNSFISQHGSVLITVFGEVGAHVILVDKVDLVTGTTILRDPYHGWQIEVYSSALDRRMSNAGGELLHIDRR